MEVRQQAQQRRIAVNPVAIDLLMTLAGLTLVTVGACLVYLPAGLIVAGVALFYLGVWHR